MNICVFGAGSIGGYLAACLAQTQQHSVSVVARGAHLDAIRRDGLKLVTPGGIEHVRFAHAEERPERLPPQDIVFVTLKAHSLPGVAMELRALLKPEGYAVFVTNGVPWWWGHGIKAASARPMQVDEQVSLANALEGSRAVGCVVYSINEVTEPGTVVHRGNNRWILGEPSNELSTRLRNTVDLMNSAGLLAEGTDDLRLHIWKKLLRNVPFNPLCALARLSAGEFAQVPELVTTAQLLTDEVIIVARAKGWELPASRASDVVASGGAINGTPTGGRSSMHQDVLANRPLEVEAILGQVQQFAREEDVPTPTLDVICAITRGLDLSIRRTSETGEDIKASSSELDRGLAKGGNRGLDAGLVVR